MMESAKKADGVHRRFLFVGILLQLMMVIVLGGDNTREDTTVDIAHYGEIKTAITTNKTKAFLSCESGDMVVTVDFKDPFFGIIYANRDPLSPCQVEGYGDTVYTIRLPLQGCGTREEPKRTFINDIVVRFRKGLIVDEDEVKTIICRYGPPVPPPIVPLTPLPPLPVEPPGIVAKPKRLTEAEIYVIMCFLLFLALLLLGIGLAYYCLKRRNIKIVRKRRAISSAPASEITKLSGSTMGTLSAFDGFRIPRATTAAHSITSGSEAALLTHGDHSDTMASDYPSESPSSMMHSDTEEVETTRRDTTLVSESTIEDHYHRYDNRSFLPDQTAIQRLEATPTPPRSQQLTTIYEQDDYMMRREEYERSLLSARRLLPHQLPPPPPGPAPVLALPPVYAKIRKKQQDDLTVRHESTMISDLSEEVTRMRFAPAPPRPSPPDHDEPDWSRRAPPTIPRVTTTATVSEARSVSEYLEEISRREMIAPSGARQVPNYENDLDSLGGGPLIETTPALYRGPPVTQRHTIDDLYLTTVTETHSKEDVLKHIRQTTQSHIKEPPPKWDVTIRTYPPENGEFSDRAPTVTTTDSEVDQWDQMSYVSERPQSLYEPDIPPPPPPQPPPNWDVLIRVLAPKAPSVTYEEDVDDQDDDEEVDALSVDDRERWKRIITTDTTLRTMLQEARTIEELESIRMDERYERLFEPRKWDVIIRILAGPPDSERAPSETSSTVSEIPLSSFGGPRRYRKKSDREETRSRRSSLPPVYEYEDLDVGGITPTTTRSRRTSRSSDYDLHSMDEQQQQQQQQQEEEVEEEEAIRYERDHRTSMWTKQSTEAEVLRSGSDGYSSRSVAERSTTEIVEAIPSGVFDPSSSRMSSVSASTTTRDGGSSSSRRGGVNRNQHRHLERSSTEILVNPGLRLAAAATAAAASTHTDETYSIPETEISDYMR